MMRLERRRLLLTQALLLFLFASQQAHGFALPLDVDLIHQALVALQNTATSATSSAASAAATVVSPSFFQSLQLVAPPSLPPTAAAVVGDDLWFAAVNVMEAQQQQQQRSQPKAPPPITAARPFFTPLFNFTLMNGMKQQQQQQQNSNNDKQEWTLQDIASILQGIPLGTNSNTNSAARSLSQTLTLTPHEQALFRLIMEVRRRFAPSTTIRIAGGWVRDKLLQRNVGGGAGARNVDIDVVLSDMSGSEFARLLHDYLIQQQQQQQTATTNDNYQNLNLNISLLATPSSSSTAASSSPTSKNTALKEYKDTASQHLQTASLRIGGDFQLDFCQMRLETYNDKNSRVPSQTGMAQAVQDAFRRDLTINALYFNLNTNRVEDWTERGLPDLIRGNLATPTPLPKKALLQDPLRILRAFRFAAQLSFYLDPALFKAGSDGQVHVALQQKVSAARMGNEMNGIFDSANPTRGIGLLLATNLSPIVFSVNREGQPRLVGNNKPVDATVYQDGYQLLFRTQTLASRIFSSTPQQSVTASSASSSTTTTTRNMPWDQEGRRCLWYAAFLKPFHDSAAGAAVDTSNTSIDNSRHNRSNGRIMGKRQRRQGSIVNHLLVQQWGRPTRDVESIESIIQGANNLRILMDRYKDVFMTMTTTMNSRNDGDDSIFVFGSRNSPMAVADLRLACYKVLKRIGPLWKESLILALALSASIPLAQAVVLFQNMVLLVEDRLCLNASLLFVDKSSKKKQGVTILKPLLNGDEIQKLALVNLQGQAFRKIMAAQEEWQIRNCWDVVDNDKVPIENGSSSSSNEASKKKAALIDYLVQTFPEYC